MKNPRIRRLVAAWLPVVVVACGSAGGSVHDGGRDSAKSSGRDSASDAARDGVANGAGDGGGDAGPPSVTCTDGTIVANEMNDYLFTSALSLPVTHVKPMSNLTFDWSGVTHDFNLRAVNPTTDLNTIFLLVLDLPLATSAREAANDTLSPSSVVVAPPPIFTPTGSTTSAPLYGSFSAGGVAVSAMNFGQYLDATVYSPANTTFVIAAQTGSNLGKDIRMMQAFELDPASANTTVTMTNSSTTLAYSADLHHLHPTGVPAGTAGMTLDWGSMKTNALGVTFDLPAITSAIVGQYDQTLDQIEAQFGDLQAIATHLYSANIYSGYVLDFTTLADSAGKPFPGVDATGTWLVALICGNCNNPAPWYLTVLEPTPQPCAK
jgi:hypothetical protein